jgi:hypothetical protein
LTSRYLRDKYFLWGFINQIRVIYPANFKNFMKSTTSKLRLIRAFPMRAMFALLTAVFVLGIGARAATVTNEDDSGAGSLRQAIAGAATGETIIFSYGKSIYITLTSPITIDKDIVIDGSGNYDVTISGGQATSIFKIASGNVEIKSLTLQDGLAQGGEGEIPGRQVSHGAGGGGAGMGGAIAVSGGTVLINGVEFIDNKAKGGNGGNAKTPFGGNAGDDYAGAGGGSNFGSGGSRVNWGNDYQGKAGGFGGGGSGGLDYQENNSYGGAGGFGGGGGGGGSGFHYTSGGIFYNISAGPAGQAGLFGGAGSEGQTMSNWQGSGDGGGGGGGGGLGGALFIKAGDVTVSNSTFTGSVAEGGTGGAGSTGGADGQGVGGAIFVYQTGNLNLSGSTFAQSQSSVSGINNNDIYVMPTTVSGLGIVLGNDTFTSTGSTDEEVTLNITGSSFSSIAVNRLRLVIL